MSDGLEFYNLDSGKILWSSRLPNLRLIQKLTSTGTSPATGATNFTISFNFNSAYPPTVVYRISYHNAAPLIPLMNPNGLIELGGNSYSSSCTIYGIASSKTVTLEMYVFSAAPPETIPGGGFEQYNTEGTLVFSLLSKPLRIVGKVGGWGTLNLPPDKIYGALQDTYYSKTVGIATGGGTNGSLTEQRRTKAVEIDDSTGTCRAIEYLISQTVTPTNFPRPYQSIAGSPVVFICDLTNY